MVCKRDSCGNKVIAPKGHTGSKMYCSAQCRNRVQVDKRRRARNAEKNSEWHLLARAKGVEVPRIQTLKLYGTDAEHWVKLLQSQGWRCPICRRGPDLVRRWSTDHVHSPKKIWSRMEDSEKSSSIRGITCDHCNWQIIRSLTLDQARQIVLYLEEYESKNHSGRQPAE